MTVLKMAADYTATGWFSQYFTATNLWEEGANVNVFLVPLK
jgi:uncharacterized protein YqgC (DUF456 family)